MSECPKVRMSECPNVRMSRISEQAGASECVVTGTFDNVPSVAILVFLELLRVAFVSLVASVAALAI